MPDHQDREAVEVMDESSVEDLPITNPNLEDESFVFRWATLMRHLGPGFLMCIAYIDPGNLEADLQTGAKTGYTLLWVVLFSTIMGLVLQARASKLGVVTSRHLAAHCRDRYPPGVRVFLWLMAELAIVGSDIQEVIGTALALSLLSGGAIPLWVGVLTAAGVAFLLLALERAGVRWLERTFQGFVTVMVLTIGAVMFRAGVDPAAVAKGMLLPQLPRSTVAIACGLLGAIIMPHNLFLHSALVHARPLGEGRRVSKRDSIKYYNMESGLALLATLFVNTAVICVFAASVHGTPEAEGVGLANAGQILGAHYGRAVELLWGVGLLAAGQSSTMTGTYAGQFVMDGFLALRLTPSKRALLTRSVALCPTLFFAFASPGELDTMNQWINILQSIQLPFAVIPLLVLTSSRGVLPRRYLSSWFSTATAWGVALGIIAINSGTAVETFLGSIPAKPLPIAVFAGGVLAYGTFMLGLVSGCMEKPAETSSSVDHAPAKHGDNAAAANIDTLVEPLIAHAAAA